MFDRRFSIDFFKVSGYTILYTRGESRVVVEWTYGRWETDGWTDGRTDVRAKVRTKRSGLSSCLQPRHSSSVCRPRGGMNAFHYDSYLLPDLSTLSASTPSLLSFSHGGRFDGISSRSRRIRRRSGEEREREKRYRRPKAPHQPSLYLSTARFIVGKPADFFSFLFCAATHRPTHRPTDRSPGSSTTIIRRIFRVPDRFETRETRSIEWGIQGKGNGRWRESARLFLPRFEEDIVTVKRLIASVFEVERPWTVGRGRGKGGGRATTMSPLRDRWTVREGEWMIVELR